MKESEILAACLRLGRGVTRLFRNNVGQFRTEDGRVVRTGLCVGSSDIIGWRVVTVTPEMVGQRVAVFVALECKSPIGRPSKEQLAFVAAVQAAGGIAGVVRSEAEAEAVLGGSVGRGVDNPR